MQKWWIGDSLYNNPNIAVFSIKVKNKEAFQQYLAEERSIYYEEGCAEPYPEGLDTHSTNEYRGHVWLESFNDEPIQYRDGTKRWYHRGRYHRDNGPAVLDSHGKWLVT